MCRLTPLFANGGDLGCQLDPTACVDSRTFVPEAQIPVAGVDGSLCFGRGCQIKASGVLRQAMAKGKYLHLSVLDLITTGIGKHAPRVVSLQSGEE